MSTFPFHFVRCVLVVFDWWDMCPLSVRRRRWSRDAGPCSRFLTTWDEYFFFQHLDFFSPRWSRRCLFLFTTWIFRQVGCGKVVVQWFF